MFWALLQVSGNGESRDFALTVLTCSMLSLGASIFLPQEGTKPATAAERLTATGSALARGRGTQLGFVGVWLGVRRAFVFS